MEVLVAKGELAGVRDIAVAMFAGEVLDGGLDYATIERLHRGEIDDWLHALRVSGLVGDDLVDAIGERWRMDPRQLLDVLLAEADQMTQRRYHTTWAALDRLAPLSQLG